MNRHKIMLCFVRSDSDILEASWLNRAAATMAPSGSSESDPPFIHAELLFVPQHTAEGNDTVSGLACSIVYNGSVHLEKKRFSRKEWFFRSMECSESQYNTMMQFCQNHEGESFNHLGYFLFWSPIRPSPQSYTWLGLSPRWYCSEIVIGALKEGGILDDDVNNSMHPHELFIMLQGSTMADCGRNMNSVNLRFV